MTEYPVKQGIIFQGVLPLGQLAGVRYSKGIQIIRRSHRGK